MLLFTEKYRPSKIADFIGMSKAKKVCSKLAVDPFDSAWLFIGKSGTGKTTLALALADEMGAELHHIPSQGCTLDIVKDLKNRLAYMPMMGKGFHLVLVDEADQMTLQAQHMFLSLLDSTGRPKNTVFIFTCNSIERFEDRLLSRFIGKVPFSTEGLSGDIAELLARVWENEGEGETAPNFARIVKESNNNIRASLAELQNKLVCG
jgi:DNA polymerase III delta prime subunit